MRKRKEDQPFEKPNRDGNVWPKQMCPAFTPREGAAAGIHECWYCRFADFHLDKPRALDVGVCNYPNVVYRNMWYAGSERQNSTDKTRS